MKAQDLLKELKSQISSTPDKGQMKVFEEKYANNKINPLHITEPPMLPWAARCYSSSSIFLG